MVPPSFYRAAMFPWLSPKATDAAMTAAVLTASTMAAANVTIAHRLALLASPSLFSGGAKMEESFRMVAEKFDAAAEGVFDASLEAGRVALRASLAPITPDALAGRLIGIGLAAAKPAARKAKANARRFSRTS